MADTLFFGDNLSVLREEIPDASVDLIYLDPPFNSAATYNVLFKAPDGRATDGSIEAFEDTWHWGDSAADAYEQVLTSGHGKAATLLRAMRGALGENDMMAYLAMMAVRLIELHRVLKPTGSLYLHCDPTASHYLKLLLDGVFGGENFLNEIVWQRTSAANNPRRWGPVHDCILFYAASPAFTWNRVEQAHDEAYLTVKYRQSDERGRYRLSDLTAAGVRRGDSGEPWKGFDPTPLGRHWGVPRAAVIASGGGDGLTSQAKLDLLDAAGYIYWTPGRGGKPGFPQFKRYLGSGQPIQDVITDIPPINSQAQERLGYPTQKPLALLERIIAASSNLGDVVLDPFCGCGTAVHAAQKLGRRWIGIDLTHLAVSLIERRLKDAFPDARFEVKGTPKDLAGARDLAARDKHQFQWWAVSLVDAVPQGGRKKGADRGIDGIRWVRTGPNKGDLQPMIVSVKGGENVSVRDVRDLVGTVEREKAAGGLLVTLAPPTRDMLREAASHGFFDYGLGRTRKIMVKTIEDLLRGVSDDAERLPPLGRQEGFKAAPRERRAAPEQGGLEF